MHNAGKLIDDLRDHLARHDKRTAFLFGAGTSYSVYSSKNTEEHLIPDMKGLTELCENAVRESYAEAWETVNLKCKENIDRDPNVEDILSRVHMMIEAVGNSGILENLNKEDLTNFENIIRREIAGAVSPSIDTAMEPVPHRKFARWIRKVMRQHPVEIFTVNYDVLFEEALEADRVPIFDGFVGSYQPFFNPDSLRHKGLAPGDSYTRLWKMHGSVTWHKVRVDTRTRIVKGDIGKSGEMILPSLQKYDESRQQPYVAFTDRLSRFLELEDALLIVCGFSFVDQHINDIVFGSLENHPRTHVYALQYDDHGEDTDLIERGQQYPNMIIAGPTKGIIGGKTAEWEIPNDSGVYDTWLRSLTEQTSAISNVPAREMVPGRLEIGDFVQFCNFLESITSQSESP